MNFTIHRNPLFEALQKIQSVVEKKNAVQILGNILFTIKNQQLFLSATDLEVGIKITLPVESSIDGRVTISAKHFFDIIKELPEKPLQVTRKENSWVEIISGKSKFNLVSLPADEYPALPNFEEKNYFEARVNVLIEMIDRTQFAVSTDASRYLLNGVYFEPIQNGLMKMTATDGHRLSFVENEVFKTPPDFKRGIIIPKKGLAEFRKLLGEGGESVGIAYERGFLYTHIKDLYFFVKLIDGEYPDCTALVPKFTDQVIEFERGDFNSALKRVSLLAHEKSRSVKLMFQSDMLVISTSNPDMGEAREEIEVRYSGEPFEISFNSKYLLEYFAIMTCDQIEFHLKDRLSPGILKGTGLQNYTYVIMPMRV